MADLLRRVSLSPEVLFQIVQNEAVLFDLVSEKYFTLNEAGGRMWQLLGEFGDPERVIPAVAAEFNAEETVIRADLTRLIDQLAAAGLVSVNATP